jgi:hypothetical protein
MSVRSVVEHFIFPMIQDSVGKSSAASNFDHSLLVSCSNL